MSAATAPPVTIVGVPTQGAGMPAGTARGVGALRAAHLVAELERVCDVADDGDVALGRRARRRDAATMLLDPDGLSELARAVDAAVTAVLRREGFPVVLGGDCPIVLGCLRAARRGNAALGSVHVDAHEDHYLPRESPTGAWSDCEVAFAIGSARFAWDPELAGEQPFVDPSRIAILGVRDAVQLAGHGVATLRERVVWRDDRAVSARPQVALDAVDAVAGGRFWLHLDWDVLDESVMPAAVSGIKGGLDWDTLDAIVGPAVADLRCVGLSAGTYNPDRDPDGTWAAAIVERLVVWLGGRHG